MSTTSAGAKGSLTTAEEFARLASDQPMELIKGEVVTMPPPPPFHGLVCGIILRLLGNYVTEKDLGRVIGNDSAIITGRNPDTVRGSDVAYYSYARVPKGTFPRDEYLDVMPELVFEVRSPSDRWSDIFAKITEYLKVGILVVCVVDPKSETIHVYRDDEIPQTLHNGDELRLPDLLGDFSLPLRELFA